MTRQRSMRRGVRCLGAAIGIAALLGYVAPVSATAESSIVAGERVGMNAHTVTEVVSHHNGHAKLRLDNGETVTLDEESYQIWLKAFTQRGGGTVHPNGDVTAGPQPANTVPSNCGYAFAYLLDTGQQRYTAWTGFNVSTTVIDFYWVTYVNGAGGTPYSETFIQQGYPLLDNSWSTSDFQGTVPASDLYSSDVDPTSFAMLWYGQICSAAPGIFDDSYIS